MRQYALHRGVSVEAVSKAVKRGRISTTTDGNGDRKIDPAVADQEWLNNSDPSKFRSSGQPNNEPLSIPDAPAHEGAIDKVGHAYRSSRAVKETYSAQLQRLEYEKAQGKLIEVTEVEKTWLNIAAIVRTKVLAVPAKMKQRHHEFTPDMYIVLEGLVRETLEELSASTGVPE